MHTSSETSQGALLFCRQCGELYPLATTRPVLEPDEEEILDLQSFQTAHREHRVEQAIRLPEPALHDRPAWDPMARRWYRVGVGEHAFVVCSSRTSIEEPRQHRICDEPPALSIHTEVDEPMLRRALDQHWFPHRVSSQKIDAFIESVRHAFAAIDGDDVEISYDDPAFANAEMGACPPKLCENVRLSAAEIFAEESERRHIDEFINANVDEYGALAVRVRREINAAA